jgi:pimeloyl-ACP methyl ester carboxylesterase
MGTERRLAAAVCLAALCAAAADSVAADAPDDAGKEVVVSTSDGMKLAGTWWDAPESGAPGAVLLHMEKSDRSAWTPLVASLRARGFDVLALDLRGHGGSVKQARGGDLAARAAKGDAKLFAEMVQDAIAGVRFLVKDGKCGAKRVAVVGAGATGAVAVDTARRFPAETAAVVCLTPGPPAAPAAAAPGAAGAAGAAPASPPPPDKPILLLVHQSEADAGARALHDAIPKSRLVVYEEAAPASASADGATWAHGTRMLGRIPLVEQTVASFLAASTGSKKDDVLLDGILDAEAADGGAWTHAGRIASGPEVEAWAYRVGRRVQFAGRVKGKAASLFVGVATHYVEGTAPGITSDPASGFPEIGAVDLARSVFTWVEPIDSGKSSNARSFVHRVRPAVRVVKTADGFTFEGEWITDYGDGPKGPVDPEKVRITFEARAAVPERPKAIAPGAVAMEIGWQDAAVAVPAR